MFKALIAAAALIAGFFLLPTDPISATYAYSCPYTDAHRQAERQTREVQERLYPGSTGHGHTIDLLTGELKPEGWLPETYTETGHKSGLRKAIEGRLKWLGVDGDLSFLNSSTCS